jgi:hypothetical protein
LQRRAQLSPDARRDAAGRNGDPARSRFHRGLHRDEAVFGLVDRAQQEFVFVGQRAHANGRRLFLRREDDEERVGDIVIRHVVVVADPGDVRTDFVERLDFFSRLAIVFGADHDALAPAQIESDREENERVFGDVERFRGRLHIRNPPVVNRIR